MKTKKIILGASLLCLGMTVSNVYATEIDFPPGQSNGTFSCTATSGTMVQIDTKNVDVEGFCGGQYITSPGHANMPAEIVNQYYFHIQKSATKFGAVYANISSGSGTITCVNNGGDSTRQLWVNGGEYCALPSVSK